MLPGFPKIVRRTAAIPTTQPVIIKRILSFDKPFEFSIVDFIQNLLYERENTIIILEIQWKVEEMNLLCYHVSAEGFAKSLIDLEFCQKRLEVIFQKPRPIWKEKYEKKNIP